MRIISNQNSGTHLVEILKALDNAEEIIICTAFLKSSGLNLLIENISRKKSNPVFYVGTNFYQTEPDALHRLYKDGHKIFLNTNKIPTFHPKIFYFQSESHVTVFIGSSNLTSGGLLTNIETSVEFQTTSNTIIDCELKNVFKSFKQNSIQIDNVQIIADYERRYNLYKQKHKAADIEFDLEEQKIIEEEKKREEERLKKEEEERLKKEEERKKKTQTNRNSSNKNRLVITQEYLDTWQPIFEEYKKFKELNNGNPIVPQKHKLHSWFRKQKDLYQAIDENGNRLIPQSHLKLLNGAGFYWGNGRELQWMEKWEFNLAKSIEYSRLNKLPYTWVTVEKNNPKFEYKRQAQWCMDQRMRIRGTSDKPLSAYEEKRLKEAKFLASSDNERRSVDEETILQKLIKLTDLKTERLSNGVRKWLPSQTDPDPVIAELGNWLNDKIEWVKKQKKNKTNEHVASDIEKELLDLGIYVDLGYSKTYFETNAQEYLEMRKKYPINNPEGEERKKYDYILGWASLNKNRFDKFPEWRQKD